MMMSVLSLLIVLFAPLSGGPPLVMPGEMDLVLYQTPIVAPAAMARTGLASYRLQGPVREVREELAASQDKETVVRQLLQTMQFDTHGNLTDMRRYWLQEIDPNGKISDTQRNGLAGKDGILREGQTYSITHTYDAQGRLQQSTLTPPHLPHVRVEAKRTYTPQDRLTDIRVVITDNSSEQSQQATITASLSLDTGGRLTAQRLLTEAENQRYLLASSTFHYVADGSIVEESRRTPTAPISHRRVFNAKGLLSEWFSYNDDGSAAAKLYITYNAQGECRQVSNFTSGNWNRMAFDGYKYDEHGNWIVRAIHLLPGQEKDAQPTTVTEYRTISYQEQAAPGVEKK